MFEINDISHETMIALYLAMLKIRKVELKILEHYHEDEMRTPVHLCIGQEAVAAGVCLSLDVNDYVFSNHRGHGHYLAKGGDLKALIAELYNRETGCSKGRGGSMHLIDTAVGLLGSSSIVSGCIPLATGAALGAVMKNEDTVSVAFFGDGAVEEGAFYESINFAILKNLPVIYVCENNFYAVCSPLSNRQARDDIYRRGEGFSLPGYRIDGNDVVEVYKTATRAVKKAREGKGPSLIECRTYRLNDHHGTGSGVELGYRTEEELNKWKETCPVLSFEKYLLSCNIITASELKKANETLDREIADAFRYAQNSPLPLKSAISSWLFQ
jgi:TPP-dependent pyruvate/acetoin dehydrogenase alpha subunit